MRIALCSFVIFFLLLIPLSGTVIAAPKLYVGGGTHLAQTDLIPEASLSLAQLGGITSIRDEIGWASAERTKGVYAVPQKLDQALAVALSKGIEPMLILDYGNKFYDNRGMPETEEAQQAFVHYAEFLANYYKGRVSMFEVWNEWNLGGGIRQRYVFVKSVYRGLLGRKGLIDPATDAGVQDSIAAYEGKTITKNALIASLFNSPEGQVRYPASRSDTEFIADLYQNCLQRAASQSEIASWQTALDSGTLRSDVARSLVLSSEYAAIWLSKSDSTTYVRLLKKTYTALKAIDPTIKVIAGAVGGWDDAWIDKMMADGAINYMDGLSVHPYNFWNGVDGTPEKALAWLERLEDNLKAYAPAGNDVPLYISEIGWPNDTGPTGTPMKLTADYVGRLFLSARSRPYIKGIWWYDFQNDGTNLKLAEQNFGLVLRDLTPKPAYFHLQDIAQLASEAEFAERINTSSPALWALRFTHTDGTTSLAVWVDQAVVYNRIDITFDAGTTADLSVGQIGNGTRSSAFIDGLNRQISVSASGNPWLVHGSLPAQGAYTVTPNFQSSGDIDHDNLLSVKDALLALKIAVKLAKPTTTDLNTGDVAPLTNGMPAPDGRIDLDDALLILKKTVGLINW